MEEIQEFFSWCFSLTQGVWLFGSVHNNGNSDFAGELFSVGSGVLCAKLGGLEGGNWL